MLTTGFKLFFGFFAAALTAAIVYGYATGGNHVGPLTLGYKGGVGDHMGYGVLLGLATLGLVLSLVTQSFRDADAEAAASYLGTDTIPVGQRPAEPSVWPLATALSIGIIAVGLVVNEVLFVAGLIALFICAFEWMIQAWADRATGDPATNKSLRDELMTPIELPIGGLLIAAVVVVAMSRILLTVSKTGAVVAGGVISAVFFLVAVLVSRAPKLPKGAIGGLIAVGALGLIGAGIVSAANGEREFHHVGEEHGEEHGDDHEEHEE